MDIFVNILRAIPNENAQIVVGIFVVGSPWLAMIPLTSWAYRRMDRMY
jgi:hypothetical protein